MNLFLNYIELSRLHRPIGIWLLLFPGLVGLSMSQQNVPLSYWGIFILGAIIMRSAGCIYNDIIDRSFDRNVMRTKNRPLVKENNPLSIKWAYVFLGFNLFIGFLCLVQFNLLTIIFGFIIAIMIMLYPWMKRIIYWPQLFLGFTMNMGFIVGLTATETSFSIAALFIYLGLVCWTFGYDTIYGFQDVDDDRLIGVKSASLKVHQYPKRFIAFLYSISLLSWIGAGVLISLPSNYYLFIIGIGFLLSWQVFTLNIKDSDNCLKRFQSNQWVGILLWLGFVLSK